MSDIDETEWSTEAEDNLIDMYEANRCMWATNDKKYRDRNKKTHVKKAMARRLEVTIKAMESKWKSIRTMYRKAVKTGKSGSAAKDLTEHQKGLIRRLAFLAPFTKGATGVVSSLDESDDDSVNGAEANRGVVNNNLVIQPEPQDHQENGPAAVAMNGQVDVVEGLNGVIEQQNETEPPIPAQAEQADQSKSTQDPAKNSAVDEPQPGPSGVTTRSGRPKPSKKKGNKKPAAAAGSADQVAQDAQVDLTASPLMSIPDSPRSPTPPAQTTPKKSALTVDSPPRAVVKAVRGKKKEPKITLKELRSMLEDEEAELSGSVSIDQPFSSLDESPLSAAPSATSSTKKKMTAVDEERVLTLREVRSTMHAFRQQSKTQSATQKRADPEDEIGWWAWQCERKVRKLQDPILQEDLMDHVSVVIKRATRGGWSATQNMQPRFGQPQQTGHSPALPSFVHSAPVCTTSAPSQMFPLATPADCTRQYQPSSHHQQHPQQQAAPSENLSVFANWLQTGHMGSSPSMPQAPMAVPVSGAMLPFTSKAGTYTSLPGN